MTTNEVRILPNFQELVSEDKCPVEGCGGELDTGWECNSCDFDAYLIATAEEVETKQ